MTPTEEIKSTAQHETQPKCGLSELPGDGPLQLERGVKRAPARKSRDAVETSSAPRTLPTQGEEERARGPHSLGESAFPTLPELRAGTRLLTNNARAPSAVTRLPAPPRLICCCARDAPEPNCGKSCYHQEQSAGPDSRQAGRGRRGEQRTPGPGLKCAYFSSGNISAEGKPAFMKEGRRCLTTATVRVVIEI